MFKFGDKSISKLYLGDKPIARAYLGGKLVYAPHTVIEYLEFDGTKYIDTGMLSTPTSKWEADFQSDKAVGETFHAIFGAQTVSSTGGASYRVSCIIISANTCARYVLSGTSISISDKDVGFSSVADANNRHVYGIDVKSYTAYVDSATIKGTTVANLSTEYPVYIMARNGNGTATNCAKGKLYGFKHWEDDVLVQDLIPVKRSDGVKCMYDRVENKYYELITT